MQASRWLSVVQVVTLCLLGAGLGYLADSPKLTVVAPGSTTLKLMVRHSGKVIGQCEELDEASLERKAANMRQVLVCPREKSPMAIRLTVNSRMVVDEIINPSGIHHDGVLAYYRSFEVQEGRLNLEVGMTENAVQDADERVFSYDIEATSASIIVVQLDDAGVKVYQPGIGASS